MPLSAFRPALAACILSALPFSALAQALDLGQEEYQRHCSACHGETGKGDGIIGLLFVTPPRDLTGLAKANGGKFPEFRVYQAIDGRLPLPGHGTSEMPIWGDYFIAEAWKDGAETSDDAEYIAQGRILSVMRFLESIQED